MKNPVLFSFSKKHKDKVFFRTSILSMMLLGFLAVSSFAQQANVTNQAVSPVPMVNGGTPSFTVTQTNTSFTNGGNGINTSLTDVTNGAGSGVISYKVSDAVNTYSAGNSVGFRANQSSGSFLIKLYNNGALVQTSPAITLTGDKEHMIVATAAYDEIELVYTRTVVLFVGSSIDVYYAINNKSIPGPALSPCSTPFALNQPAFPVTATGGKTLLALANVSSIGAVASTSTTDFATMTTGTGTTNISVVDNITNYPAGTFAGFDVENTDFTATNHFQGMTVTTYLDGVKQEASGTITLLVIANSSQSLVSYAAPTGTGRQTVGFVATKDFDEIKLEYSRLLGNDLKVYSAVVDDRCTGTNLACNTAADFTYPTFPVSEYSGQAGGCLAALLGQGALVSADTSDYATFLEGVQLGCFSWIGVKNNKAGDVYPAGTFAGFQTAEYGFISISVADVGTVTTYLNGVQQEASSAANIIATSFVTGQKRIVGFKTTKDFDEVRFTKTGIAAVSLGETRVYKAVIEKVCPGPALVCNVPTRLNRPTFPMVTSSYMVPYGVVVGCLGSVTGEEAMVSADPNDFALMSLIQALGCYRHVAVKDNATTHPIGTYVSVEIENTALLGISVGDGQFLKTYLNGVFQEQIAKGSLTTATVLTGGRQEFGFVTTKPFDELWYEEFTLITPLNVSGTKVYGFNVMKTCAGPVLACSTDPIPKPVTAKLNLPGAMNGNVGYPVTVKSVANDAFLGVGVCTNQLLNPERVVSADTTDYATVAATGVNCWASITVTDELATYPIGSFAGFDIFNSTAINLDLLGGAYVTTYLNGVQQEFKTANGLLADIIGGTGIATSSRRRIGFVTTKAFDAIKYTQGQIAGINLGSTQVFNAVVSKVAADCAAPALVLATPPPAALTGVVNTPKSGNAATDLAPTGGTGPYTYSNGSADPACVAPVGATALTGVNVTAAGAYTYTMPATPGNYYYCVKVCDATLPTAICSVKVYPVTVTATAGLILATPPAAALTATPSQAKAGNAATDLAPSGGTGPYTYSNGSADPACVAPVGATALTGVNVTAAGAYTYTAPATPGTYYYCVKVCDSTLPTAICSVKVYTVNVATGACTVGTAIPGVN